MATILQFPARDARDQSTAPASGRSAEIVFFTGVRYERVAEVKRQPRRKVKQASPQNGLQAAL